MQYDPEQRLATEIKQCIGVTRDMDVTSYYICTTYLYGHPLPLITISCL